METLVPLFVIACVVLALIGLAMAFFRYRRQSAREAHRIQHRRQDFEERARRAVWASATIVTLRRSDIAERGQPTARLDLRLQVQPPDGEPYPATTAWLARLDNLPQLQPGQSISVKIDPDDPQRIYPNLAGVEYWVWD